MEVCQATGPGLSEGQQAVFCGGSLLQPDHACVRGARSPVTSVDQPYGLHAAGFRVARTVAPPPTGP